MASKVSIDFGMCQEAEIYANVFRCIQMYCKMRVFAKLFILDTKVFCKRLQNTYKVVLTVAQKAFLAFTSSLTTTINKTQKVHFAKMCLPLPNEKE